MSSVSSGFPVVRDRLRIMNRQLSVLNHCVSGQLKLRDVDLDCLDLIARLGPIGPSELARRTGVHPATMTGILDRLQRAGWIARERDPAAADRRGVMVRMRQERMAEIPRLYRGMLSSLADICDEYSEQELAVIADFLDRVTLAGARAVEDLSTEEPPARADQQDGDAVGPAGAE
jgi:DNA-binding MarR family transcriptional regulator